MVNNNDTGFNPNDVYKDPSIKVIPDNIPGKAEHGILPKDMPQTNHSEGVQISLPVYQCFKKVHALKIRAIGFDADHAKIENRETDGTAMILPQDERYAPFKVSAEYVRKHDPQAGGYWIKYEDGYESWSPAEAFESGYKMLGAVNPHNLGPVQNAEVVPELYRKDLKILTECMDTGEPTFCLRAKDVIAIRALKRYVNECKDQGCTDDFVREVSNIFDRFAQFASENPFKMKLPD